MWEARCGPDTAVVMHQKVEKNRSRKKWSGVRPACRWHQTRWGRARNELLASSWSRDMAETVRNHWVPASVRRRARQNARPTARGAAPSVRAVRARPRRRAGASHSRRHRRVGCHGAWDEAARTGRISGVGACSALVRSACSARTPEMRGSTRRHVDEGTQLVGDAIGTRLGARVCDDCARHLQPLLLAARRSGFARRCGAAFEPPPPARSLPGAAAPPTRSEPLRGAAFSP